MLDDRNYWTALLGDGRPLIALTGVVLGLSGLGAIFLSCTGHFLPHDEAFLGMTFDELCGVDSCRIVHFMIHDRVSFGGALVAVAALYLWLVEFPLRRRELWAWWLLAASGGVGFGSFLAYLGYGYLDTWHGAATLLLLPCFAAGMLKLWWEFRRTNTAVLPGEKSADVAEVSPRVRWGWRLLLFTSVCLMVGGAIIVVVGMTIVFVPEDLAFIGLTKDDLHTINPRLVPLIAHDRSGFGGGVCCCGMTMLGCIWFGGRSRSLWQALCVVGIAGFGTAIGVHPAIGYTNFIHLAPAYLGAVLFATGLALAYSPPCPQCE